MDMSDDSASQLQTPLVMCRGENEKEDGMRRLVRECVMNARAPNTSPNQLTASTLRRPPDGFL